MTFSCLTDYLLDHPAFIDAIESYNHGDYKPLKNILMDVQIHSYQKTADLASKIFGLNKWQNSSDLKILIRETPPPPLDFRLPIPKNIIKVNKIVKNKSRLKVMIKNQLDLFKMNGLT